MTESALSDEADGLYQPLGGLGPWAAAGGRDLPRLGALAPAPGEGDGRAWAEVLARGTLLAAAHESGALDGMHGGSRACALSLLRGVSNLAALAAPIRADVRANDEALRLAQVATDDDLASERWLRLVHEVACRPQLTHPVRSEDGVQDHVLAVGDFKHHPNHAQEASGRWVAHAPVRVLRDEMARYLATVRPDEFGGLPAVTRAAYAHHALTHVAPFADGNGRVARVVAGAHLLRQASVPFLVFADQSSEYEEAMAAADAGAPDVLVAFVAERTRGVVELVGDLRAAGPSSPEELAAVGRWRQRAAGGAALAALLPAAAEQALDRHRRRPDLGWLSPLTGAVVLPSPLVIRVPPTGVKEVITVDAHPVLDEGCVVLAAEGARLRLALTPQDLLPAPSAELIGRVDGWLDRVVSTLALRVAAEEE